MECPSCGTLLNSFEHTCEHCQVDPLQSFVCQNPACGHLQPLSPRCEKCSKILAGPLSGKILTAGESLYYVRELLGGGGMGEVYRGVEKNRSGGYLREVAIKLNKEITTSERQDRFRREVQNLIKLHNPHNVRVYGYGEQRESGVLIAQFMAMELLRGTPLEQLLQDRPLSVAEALIIYRQVARALSEAHQKGVIHRDLKPNNILLINPPEDPPFAKLFDFGLSKDTMNNSDQKISSSGMIVGTLSYMSPEQARGDEVDQRSDIFSMGVILYEMLTQTLPFPAQNLYQIYQLHPHGPPPLSEELSPSLQELVYRSLAYDPNDRFSHLYECLSLLPSIDPGQASGLFISGEFLTPLPPTYSSSAQPAAAPENISFLDKNASSAPPTSPPLPFFSKQVLWALSFLIVISGGFAFFFLWRARYPQAQHIHTHTPSLSKVQDNSKTAITSRPQPVRTLNRTNPSSKPTSLTPRSRPIRSRPRQAAPVRPNPRARVALRVAPRTRRSPHKFRTVKWSKRRRRSKVSVVVDLKPTCTSMFLFQKNKKTQITDAQKLRLYPGKYSLLCINPALRFRRTLPFQVRPRPKTQSITRQWKRIKVKILIPNWGFPSVDGFPVVPIQGHACQIGCFTHLWEGTNRLVLRRYIENTSRLAVVHRHTLQLPARLADQPIKQRTFTIRWTKDTPKP